MNADAAADALKLAEQRHDAADDVGALRFAQKALQLDETLAGAHALMHRLKKFGPGSEMKAIVDRILQAGNHYSVFDTTYASFDANAEATAYRQLSKRVHPDKNRARGAEDAFKKLSEAHTVLSDTTLRERYNLEVMLPREPRAHPASARGGASHASVPPGGSGRPAAQPAPPSRQAPSPPPDSADTTTTPKLVSMLMDHTLVQLKEMCRRDRINCAGAKGMVAQQMAEWLAARSGHSFDRALTMLRSMQSKQAVSEAAARAVLFAHSTPAWHSIDLLHELITAARIAGVRPCVFEPAHNRLTDLRNASGQGPAAAAEAQRRADTDAARRQAAEEAMAAAVRLEAEQQARMRQAEELRAAERARFVREQEAQMRERAAREAAAAEELRLQMAEAQRRAWISQQRTAEAVAQAEAQAMAEIVAKERKTQENAAAHRQAVAERKQARKEAREEAAAAAATERKLAREAVKVAEEERRLEEAAKASAEREAKAAARAEAAERRELERAAAHAAAADHAAAKRAAAQKHVSGCDASSDDGREASAGDEAASVDGGTASTGAGPDSTRAGEASGKVASDVVESLSPADARAWLAKRITPNTDLDTLTSKALREEWEVELGQPRKALHPRRAWLDQLILERVDRLKEERRLADELTAAATADCDDDDEAASSEARRKARRTRPNRSAAVSGPSRPQRHRGPPKWLGEKDAGESEEEGSTDEEEPARASKSAAAIAAAAALAGDSSDEDAPRGPAVPTSRKPRAAASLARAEAPMATPEEEAPAGAEFEVDHILDERAVRGKKQYLVRWVGFGPEADTWEPQASLGAAKKRIKEYRARILQKAAEVAAAAAAAAIAAAAADSSEEDEATLRPPPKPKRTAPKYAAKVQPEPAVRKEPRQVTGKAARAAATRRAAVDSSEGEAPSPTLRQSSAPSKIAAARTKVAPLPPKVAAAPNKVRAGEDSSEDEPAVRRRPVKPPAHVPPKVGAATGGESSDDDAPAVKRRRAPSQAAASKTRVTSPAGHVASARQGTAVGTAPPPDEATTLDELLRAHEASTAGAGERGTDAREKLTLNELLDSHAAGLNGHATSGRGCDVERRTLDGMAAGGAGSAPAEPPARKRKAGSGVSRSTHGEDELLSGDEWTLTQGGGELKDQALSTLGVPLSQQRNVRLSSSRFARDQGAAKQAKRDAGEKRKAERAAAEAAEASTSAWKAPSWMEYQTDSDDSDSTARRKRELKRKAKQSKAQAAPDSVAPPADESPTAYDSTESPPVAAVPREDRHVHVPPMSPAPPMPAAAPAAETPTAEQRVVSPPPADAAKGKKRAADTAAGSPPDAKRLAEVAGPQTVAAALPEKGREPMRVYVPTVEDRSSSSAGANGSPVTSTVGQKHERKTLAAVDAKIIAKAVRAVLRKAGEGALSLTRNQIKDKIGAKLGADMTPWKLTIKAAIQEFVQSTVTTQ